MRNQKEINNRINILCEKERTEKVETILDVLENNLSYEEIEEKYYDEENPWLEQTANGAREYLDMEIEFDDID